MTARSCSGARAAIIIVMALSPAAAQAPAGPPNALQGFSQNRSEPVKIESTSLELREKDKVATFIGNVNLVQGDTTLQCKTLVVYYEPGGKPAGKPGGMKTAQSTPGGEQQIRRVEAKGGVVVTQKDQVASGENGLFDTSANTVTLMGNVVVTQGQNVLRGDKLVVNLTTGVSHVESAGQGRVQGLFAPGSRPGMAPGKEGPRPPAAPLKLN
jgi:lipopolysaccharide export system protein LptA